MNMMTRYMGFGAVAFWGPDILLHVIKRYEFSSRDAHALTFLLPCSLLLVYSLTLWHEKKQTSRPSLALFMLFGFWVFGPLAVMISGIGGGARFSGLTEWVYAFAFAVLATFLFPIYGYIISVYDGSSYALVWASILVIMIYFVVERHHHQGDGSRAPKAQNRNK
jgi:hypothetical protein